MSKPPLNPPTLNKAMNFPATHLPEFSGVPANHHKTLIFFMIIFISLIIFPNSAYSQSSPGDNDSPDSATNFQPSLAVVIGVLSIMFSLTFVLLIYAKCCHRPSSPRYFNQENLGGLPRSMSRVSGVDKTVIESLPFFRFSTLKGWRDGLECAICLSRFKDVEILRLLPKCKHAFHINCVDQWLEKHSGCPLCRCQVSEEDVALFAYSNSLRFLRNNQSEGTRESEGSNMELFIEREESARFGSGRSFGKEKEMGIQENSIEDQEILHKFNHRIIVSNYDHDLMMKNRWSNVSSSDLMFLKSEMITSMTSNRFDRSEKITSMSSNHEVIKIKEEIGRKMEFERKIKKLEEPREIKISNDHAKRSMSEIIVHPRFLGVDETGFKDDNLGEISVKEERLRRLWLPIARRTVQWFVNREKINTKLEV